MSTTFPRRDLTVEDDAKTLKELELVPTAVILILPLKNVINIIYSLLCFFLSVQKLAWWNEKVPTLTTLNSKLENKNSAFCWGSMEKRQTGHALQVAGKQSFDFELRIWGQRWEIKNSQKWFDSAKIRYSEIFDFADYESQLKIKKFEMDQNVKSYRFLQFKNLTLWVPLSYGTYVSLPDSKTPSMAHWGKTDPRHVQS